MKTLVRSTLLALTLAIVSPPAVAASGGAAVTITHSGYLLDAADAPFTALAQPFTFRVFAAAEGGTPEWEATCSLAVKSGYFAGVLGAAPCAGSTVLDTADLPPGAPRWLEVSVGPIALAPRSQLAAIATSVLAANALQLGGVAAVEYVQKADLIAGGLADVDASRLTSGTIPGARLGGTYAGALTLSNAANVLAGDGAAITNLDASSIAGGTLAGGRLSGTYGNALSLTNAANVLAGSGAAITALNASALSTGTIPSARLAGTYAGDLSFTGAVSVPNGLAIPNGGALPASAGPAGSVFFNSSDAKLYVSSGGAWVAVSGSGGGATWPLGSSGNPAPSCSAIKDAMPTAASNTYYVTGATGAFAVWCDMDTDGGGWTLVMASTEGTRWKGHAAVWNDSTFDAGVAVSPASPGKSLAYAQISGDQIMFKTHSEAAGRWATFDLPAASTLLGLVGTTGLLSYPAGTYQKTITGRTLGSAAHPCWGGDWRVNYRGYYTGDASPDSSIFAPAGVAVGRPCQGSLSWGSGIGVATDSNTANGGTSEGYGGETGGNGAVTGGYVAIYVRTKAAGALPPLGTAGNPATSCNAIKAAGAAGASGLYYLTGAVIGRFQAYCDFSPEIDGGGWTLVMSTNNGTTWKGFNAIWFDRLTDFPGTPGYVAPTNYGKSPAYYQVAGTELAFRTHAEASGRWARYTLPSSTSLGTLLGTTNLSAQAAGYRHTITKVAVGASAVACFNQDWRVNWRSYGSSDGAPDSSVFAPSGLTASVRPCGGTPSYATGIGVMTDSNASAYGASFEGYGNDLSGNAAVTGGFVSIYVR